MTTIFDKSRAAVILLTLFLFPLLFLPITTEFYATNKQYLLVICAGILVLIGSLERIVDKKVSREFKIFDIPVLLFVAAIGLSVFFVSPNKVAAAIAPVNGLISIAALSILYYFLTREKHESNLSSYTTILQYSVLIVCFIEIAVYILSVSSISLPQNLTFFASPLFTPLGSIMELVAFLGFFFVYTGIRLCLSIDNREAGIADVFSFLVVTAALTLASITLFSTPRTDLPYAPFEYSLRAINIIIVHPLSALLGSGIDNFSGLFTSLKDEAYPTSQYGAIQTFSYSRSALLHILSEAGLAGAFTLLIIFLRGIYESFSLPREVKTAVFGLFLYLIVSFIVFPPSLILFFLLFVTLGLLHHDIVVHSPRHPERPRVKTFTMPVFVSSMAAVLVFVAICWGGYLLANYYRADVSFRRSASSINNRNLSNTYADQFNAVTLNPYQEKYHISFSQTNIYIANQIAVNSKNAGTALSPNDQETVKNAIKTAIEEGRAATILNDQKAANWENLGKVYKNLLNVAEKADIFAIGAYERASMLDTYNPVYKNELGEIYYLTQQYKQAVAQFEFAVNLKPNYINANYNLAWSYYQLKQPEKAVAAMENVLEILKEKPESAEYKKARADLDRFMSL